MITFVGISLIEATTAKPIWTSPATRQGRDGFCAAQRVAGKDQNDPRRCNRRWLEGEASTALFENDAGRIKKGKRVTLFSKSNQNQEIT